MKMNDLGEKPQKMEAECKPSKEPYYPSINLDAKKVPDVKKMQVGDTGTMEVKYKVRSIHAREGQGEDSYDVCLDLTACGIKGNEASEKKKTIKDIVKTVRSG